MLEIFTGKSNELLTQDTMIADTEGVPYRVRFEGGASPEILKIVQQASILMRLQHRPPLTFTALDKRATKNTVEMEEALGIHGYFDGKVTYQLEGHQVWQEGSGGWDTKNAYENIELDREEGTIKDQEALQKNPIKIRISVKEGGLYHISDLAIEYKGGIPTEPLDEDKITQKIQKNDPVNLEKAEAMAKKIARYYRTKGYPFAKALRLRGEIDRTHKTMKLIFVILLGPRAVFGKVDVKGLKHLSTLYAQNRLPWNEGELYTEEKVEEGRKNLLETGLFVETRVEPQPLEHEHSQENLIGQDALIPVPMEVVLTEGPARSIGGGIKYGTSDGWSGKVFWRHDNLRGGGESLESKLEIGPRRKELRLTYSIPDFLTANQLLILSSAAVEQKTRAFHSKIAEASAFLNLELTKNLEINYGVTGEIGRIKRQKKYHAVRLMSIPLSFQWDSTDNLLNPQKGLRAKGKTAPYFGYYEGHRGFWVNEIFASTYITPNFQTFDMTENAHVMAFWGKVGHITAKTLRHIPPTKRFYSGGGNSVRGYGYQLLGPLDQTLTPTGGKSVMEMGGEYRLPLTEKLGLSAFLEGGSVGASHLPKMNTGNFLWGTGVGIRYYTEIGPVRFDLAVPTKRRPIPGMRKKVDAPFQFYVSIGQAF